MELLVVVRPFGSHRIGDVVTDQPGIDRIVGSEQASHVVRIRPPGEES